MRVRITRQPFGMVQGMSLNYYRAGEVYDLAPSLAEYLIMEKYAIVEMRNQERNPTPHYYGEERRRRSY
jgi:hypothetical protein